MFVYVLNCHGKPLMPTNPAKARRLLKAGKAKVVRKTPFAIKPLFGSSGYRQEAVAGMDLGSTRVGTVAVANGNVVYQAEVTLRTDVSRKMEQRKMYRCNGHQCQNGHKINHSVKLNVYHVQFKRRQGGNHHGNLLTLCLTCHQAVHQGTLEIKPNRTVTKPVTEVSVIATQLKQSDWEFEPTFGYETKSKREQFLKLPKSHTSDAMAMCCEDGEIVEAGNGDGFIKRHVSQGDSQQTTGQHSQKRIPTGKRFGVRKFDLIQTVRGLGFVTGKRGSGYFAVVRLTGLV